MITIQRNQIMIEQYEEVLHVTANEIKLRTKDAKLTITGDHLRVLALTRDEILMEGGLKGMQFDHEE